MERAYKFRIYPNKTQQELIQKTFGCCRFVYNYYLDKRIQAYKDNKTSLNYYDCCKDLTNLKKELEWLKEPDKCALQNSLKNLDDAYQSFFKECSSFPRFKSKKNHKHSYKTQNYNNGTAVQFKNNHIKLPKLGWIKTRDKQIPQGRILNATISQDPSGKYYVSLCCTDVEIQHLPKTNNQVGIDLGIKNFAITSDGVKYSNPKYLQQSLEKLAKLQRELSRKTRGSSNWNKARIKVAKQYEKIRNQRQDFLQKLSTELIRENDIICIEDLQVKNMLQNHKLARSISDVSWYEFTRQLQYKADWYGRQVIKVDKFFASSQTCNCCGKKFPITKDLGVRQWICPNCKSVLDRDTNAAINILNEGLKQIA